MKATILIDLDGEIKELWNQLGLLESILDEGKIKIIDIVETK